MYVVPDAETQYYIYIRVVCVTYVVHVIHAPRVTVLAMQLRPVDIAIAVRVVAPVSGVYVAVIIRQPVHGVPSVSGVRDVVLMHRIASRTLSIVRSHDSGHRVSSKNIILTNV